jgi:hypothetical protein
METHYSFVKRPEIEMRDLYAGGSGFVTEVTLYEGTDMRSLYMDRLMEREVPGALKDLIDLDNFG